MTTPTEETGARAARERGVEGNGGTARGAGVGSAAKAVAEDVTALVRAEIDLAKAELMEGVRSKATGMGLLVGTAVLAWLGVQGLLIAAGLALALVMPGWAAALIVAGVLLLIGAVLAFVARGKLQAPVGVSTAKQQAQQDVDWAKQRLQAPQTKQQVQEDIEWTRSRLKNR